MIKNIIPIVVLSFFLLAFNTCKEEEIVTKPIVYTASVDLIDGNSANVGGNVTADGGAEVTERGIYWGTSSNPETVGTKLQIGTGLGTFFQVISGLTPGTKYYVKAYAMNKGGVSYGTETFFTTQISLPTVSTSAISELTTTSAKVGGLVTDDGGFEVTQRGVFWGVNTNPRLTGVRISLGTGEGEFSQTITGLSRAITYYVMAFATNIKGTAYGDEISFSTQPDKPTISTNVAIQVTANSAKIGGEVTSNGGSEVTERGVFWGATPDPQNTGVKLALGTGNGVFTDTLESLSPATVYYFKAFATNSVGTSYGSEYSFTTLGGAPEATTLDPTNLSTTSVTLNGLISFNDLSTNVTFEYGPTGSYGTSVAIAENPILANDDSVSINIAGLTPSTLYHFRVVAVNALGTSYGGDSTFTTVVTGITGTVSDIQGNNYPTIGIGNHYWMTENLRVTKYKDGSNIALITEDTLWVKGNPGYSWYNNDSLEYSESYGAIYNWFAVNTGKLCPAGWRVPTNNEFSELIQYFEDASISGGLLKETGFSHWKSPNTGATDEYDFTALPGGKRSDLGVFDFMTIEGNWWSSSEYSSLTASYFYLLYDNSNSFQAYVNKKNGMSVRCIKE